MVPRQLLKRALLDHSVDNEQLAEGLVLALERTVKYETQREIADMLRERGYPEAAAEVSREVMT